MWYKSNGYPVLEDLIRLNLTPPPSLPLTTSIHRDFGRPPSTVHLLMVLTSDWPVALPSWTPAPLSWSSPQLTRLLSINRSKALPVMVKAVSLFLVQPTRVSLLPSVDKNSLLIPATSLSRLWMRPTPLATAFLAYHQATLVVLLNGWYVVLLFYVVPTGLMWLLSGW